MVEFVGTAGQFIDISADHIGSAVTVGQEEIVGEPRLL